MSASERETRKGIILRLYPT